MPLAGNVTKNADPAGSPKGEHPSTEGRLTARAREAWRSIQRLIVERAQREAAAAHTLDSAMGQADADMSTSLGEALTQLQSNLDSITRECDAKLSQARASASDRLAAAKKQFDLEKASLKERGREDVARASKALTDAKWMADTLYDTTIDKPDQMLRRIRTELDARMSELTKIESASDTELVVLVRGYPKRRERGDFNPSSVEPVTETSSKALADLVSQRMQTATDALGRLIGCKGPRWFVSPLPVVYGVLVGCAVGAGVWYLRNMKVDELVGAAAAASLIVSAAAFWKIGKGQERKVVALGREIFAAAVHARALAAALSVRAEQERDEQKAAITLLRDNEVAKAQREYDQSYAKSNAAYRERLAQIERASEKRLQEARDAGDQDVANVERERRERLTKADTDFKAANASAKDRHSAVKSLAATSHDRDWSAMQSAWASGTHEVYSNVRQLGDFADGFTPWTSPLWTNGKWQPPRTVPTGVMVGHLGVDLSKLENGVPTDARLALPGPSAFPMPAVMELPDRCSLLIQSGGAGPAAVESRAAALATLRNTMLRVLTTFPPGKVRFTILDPVGLGQSFAAFMHLADYDPQLVNDRIWTEPKHIEARLTDLTEHMETVIQKYLRNEFASVEEYNERAGEVAEPYRFLVIADFPTNFNEQACKRLASIINSGPKCGVYTLIAHDTRQPMPQGVTAADLKRSGLRVVWRKRDDGHGHYGIDDPDLGVLPLELEKPPADERFNEIVNAVGVLAKDAGRVQVPFTMISPNVEKTWTMDASSDVRVSLGRAGAIKLQEMTLGRGTAQHMLIAGRTGSGKSTLLHVMITNLALWYSPDEVEMYLVDFKKGVEFKCYASAMLPHARVIAIESEREFGLSVLRRLDTELKRRGQVLRDAGVQDLRSYRQTAGAQVMPRVLLIVDEFQELFVEDDKLAQESGLLMDRLVRQGRAFGMHVILGSQTLGGAYSLARATIGQMAVRIALQCSEADSYLILSEDNAAARLLSRPGEAIYNDASGAVEGNSLFQVAWLHDEVRDAGLDRIKSRVTPEMKARLTPPIIFEGNVPAKVQRNHSMAASIGGTRLPEETAPTVNAAGQPSRVKAYLGEPVAIKEPTCATLRRQSASQLLIVGQQDESALAMLSAATIGLAAQHMTAAKSCPTTPPGELARFFILDGTAADAPTADHLTNVAGVLPARTPAVVVPYRDVGDEIVKIGAELERRVAGEITDAPAWYLIVNGLQRFRMLRRSEDEFDFAADASAAPKPEKQFARIIREGPGVGIHVLCWCDTAATLSRTLERTAVREFDFRVLFQMAAADASSIVDAPGVGTGVIGAHRALVYSEEQGVVEKFRPYAVPDDAWLASVKAQLAKL